MSVKRPIIIDCDTGTDDAIAIIAALGCEEISILGLTSVNGNVSENYTSQNNLDMMEYLDRDIPVFHGAWLPLKASRDTGAGDNVHGKTGLGDVELPRAERRKMEGERAAEFIYRMALRYPGQLEIIATGPLTNVALAIIEHDDIKALIRKIYFMGGATEGGNVTPSAEFNIWVDPEACHTVLASGIPTVMVGLNVSNQATMGNGEIERLRGYGSREGRLAADIIHYQMNRFGIGIGFSRMHDPLTLAAALYPECLSFRECFVDAECRGDYTRGHTYVDLRNRSGRQPNCSVAVGIDVEKFREWLCERIRRAGE
ncbi:MAG: nucleoside hydrolase [Erysipelotrichaceae bacterium]|nr:nucleoside hydrolase [Erysipelotrichaceae bacterium]